MFESTCEECLACEFGLRNVRYTRQVKVPLVYRQITLDCAYRAGFLVDGSLLVELKTVDRVLPVHRAQMLTYVKLLKLPQGLVINFNVPRLVDGIVSVVNTRLAETHEGEAERAQLGRSSP